MNNWFGLPEHRTDAFVNWHDTKDAVQREATAFRRWYDVIVAAGFENELEELISAAHKEGYDSGYEDGRTYY